MAIRLNAQFKQKGRPTLVNQGLEGQRYLANKIIGNLVASQPAGKQGYVPNLSVVKPVEEEVELQAMLNYWKNSWNNAPQQANEAPEAGLQENENPEAAHQQANEAPSAVPFQVDLGLHQPSLEPVAQNPEFNHIFDQQVAEPTNEQPEQKQPEPHATSVEAIEDIQAQTHLHFFKNCRLTRKLNKVKAATDEGFSVRSIRNLAGIEIAPQQSAQEPINEPVEPSWDEQQNEEQVEEQVEEHEDHEEREDQLEEQVNEPTFDDPERLKEGKTGILRLPKEGVVKSSRGTVQLLVQKNGRTMKPRYNQCGLLIGVEMSDGWELVYMPKRNRWVIFNHDGTTPLPLKITSVSFDQKGNLWYVTADGQRTIFYTDGTCETI